jgi:hypothetical protein
MIRIMMAGSHRREEEEMMVPVAIEATGSMIRTTAMVEAEVGH